MVGETVIFGLSIAECIALAAALAYVASLIRDWRPMKALRAENRELRNDLDEARVKIHDLEVKVEDLEKRTDLTSLREEHAKVVATLERVVTHLDRLDHAVKANTAATELVVKASAIAEALDHHDRKETP